MRIRITTIALAAAALSLTPWPSHAAPWPGWTDGQQMEFRLLLGGVNRQFQPEIIATAHEVCGILRADPTPAGKRGALEHLAVDHYPHQLGYALGTMVDVVCPELLGVIR
ncbi:hypothetical protein [Nocardia abscessus]|uniref:hypothetical protein n=1 Tax=Nocardia abscessus TaxID=120957 RepID=UPI0002D656D6|nr:hypothetical protein [Nocardia abscessus]MCC3333501.1 hypothetical protein [Nocardia abscessus]MCC3333616.1 hypothetical protein [Nocardia abscessus]